MQVNFPNKKALLVATQDDSFELEDKMFEIKRKASNFRKKSIMTYLQDLCEVAFGTQKPVGIETGDYDFYERNPHTGLGYGPKKQKLVDGSTVEISNDAKMKKREFPDGTIVAYYTGFCDPKEAYWKDRVESILLPDGTEKHFNDEGGIDYKILPDGTHISYFYNTDEEYRADESRAVPERIDYPDGTFLLNVDDPDFDSEKDYLFTLNRDGKIENTDGIVNYRWKTVTLKNQRGDIAKYSFDGTLLASKSYYEDEFTVWDKNPLV